MSKSSIIGLVVMVMTLVMVMMFRISLRTPLVEYVFLNGMRGV